MFVEDARHDRARRYRAQAKDSSGAVCAPVCGGEPLDAQNCQQHADEQKLASGIHISEEFNQHSKTRRI
jgi:hypothetical protein